MRPRRIHILGSPASGKSWLASKLGAVTGLPVVDLDGLCWDASSGRWGAAHPVDERARSLRRLVDQDAWIVHGSDVDWTAPALERADLVVLLTAPAWLRDLRLVTRWAGRLTGRRAPGGAGLGPLRLQLRRGHRYPATEGHPEREPLVRVRHKLVVCGSSDEVRQVLEGVLGLPGAAMSVRHDAAP